MESCFRRNLHQRWQRSQLLCVGAGVNSKPGKFAVNASANAEKLASLPPLVKVPPKARFHPTRSPIQRTISCSIFEARCERASVATCGLIEATNASARTAIYAGVGFIRPK